MSIRMKHLKLSFLLLLMGVAFVQCTKEDSPDNPEAEGNLQLEITDAPIDDAMVSGAFVTIANIQVDGEDFAGFTGKQTIDLMAYQNGNVKGLGLGKIKAGTYSKIALILDHATDESGNSPGCYVATMDGKKHDLSVGSNANQEIVLNQAEVKIEEDQTSTLLIDFDLRKTITSDNSGSGSDYKFVTTAELEAGLRPVKKEMAGTVEGKCDNAGLFTEKVIVYAYQKGMYNKDVEASGQGSSQIQFANAVSSAEVQADGSYSLNFLEEGDYEIVFIGYKDADNDDRFEVAGNLSLTITGSLNLNAISVGAQSTTTIDVLATGILPF